MNVLMLTSTLPRFAGDMQANFVGEQAEAWLAARPGDHITILAPHHKDANRHEVTGRLSIQRFVYMRPLTWQKLAYPAMLPNVRRNPALAILLPAFLFAQYRAALRLVSKGQVDMIYAHWVVPQGLVAWFVSRKLGIPYVLQNHSSDLSVLGKLGEAGRNIARTVLRGAAHFFCVNSDQRDFAIDLFTGREREKFASRCTVLPMGMVLPVNASPESGAVYDIAMIGRLSRKKGMNYLIEAAERLARRGIRPSIAIAGDGEDRVALEARVERADIAFPGFVTGEEKNRFFTQSRRFAFPAKASANDVEGLPVSLLEALCRGLPVLATRDTNIEMLPEWSEIRDLVVFVPDAADEAALDAGLERLLALDPQPLSDLARVMARYRWENLIQEYLTPIEATSGTAEQLRRLSSA